MHWKRFQLAAQLRKLQIARLIVLLRQLLCCVHLTGCIVRGHAGEEVTHARRLLSKHSEQLGIQDIDFILIRPFFPSPLSCRCLLGLAENDTTDQTKADLGSNACKSLLEKTKQKTIQKQG